MTRFHVTFGQKYAYEPHPTFPEAHPEMLLEVHAVDEQTARKLVIDTIGNQWAFIYPAGECLEMKINPIVGTPMFPQGVTHILDHTGIRKKES